MQAIGIKKWKWGRQIGIQKGFNRAVSPRNSPHNSRLAPAPPTLDPLQQLHPCNRGLVILLYAISSRNSHHNSRLAPPPTLDHGSFQQLHIWYKQNCHCTTKQMSYISPHLKSEFSHRDKAGKYHVSHSGNMCK